MKWHDALVTDVTTEDPGERAIVPWVWYSIRGRFNAAIRRRHRYRVLHDAYDIFLVDGMKNRAAVAGGDQLHQQLGCIFFADCSFLLSQDLGQLPIAAILIDGIHIDEHVILIALGIDEGGTKHVLGLWEGATEHHKVCLSLLNNLVRRNLDVQRSTLFVIDGSGALRKAIRTVFGDYAIVQRCQVHKVANVRDHLPKEMHDSVRKAMRDAYQASSVAAAKTRLLALAKQLANEHPGAAASLREGLDETLTVKGIGLTTSLERTLSTTNPIENLNGGVRDISRRVKRWRGGSMILRWVAAAALERQKSFRRLRGYKGMPAFIAFLRRNDAALNSDVDQVTDVA